MKEPFNLCCNFLRLIPDPCLDSFPNFFFFLFPVLYVLFFKLGEIIVHFIITAWIYFKQTIAMPARSSYSGIYITCAIKYWQTQLFSGSLLLLTCPRSSIRVVVERNRSPTWKPVSLKPFLKALSDKPSQVTKEYIKAHSECRVRERI